MPRKPPAKTWKKKEQALAALFGTKRRALSGGNSSHGEARDDAHHDALYLECKYSARHVIWSLFRFIRDNCNREYRPGKAKRRPVIGLYPKGESKCLLVIHQDDLLAVAAELLDASSLAPEFLDEYRGEDIPERSVSDYLRSIAFL